MNATHKHACTISTMQTEAHRKTGQVSHHDAVGITIIDTRIRNPQQPACCVVCRSPWQHHNVSVCQEFMACHSAPTPLFCYICQTGEAAWAPQRAMEDTHTYPVCTGHALQTLSKQHDAAHAHIQRRYFTFKGPEEVPVAEQL
jgi:hypothetical protein